MEDSQKDISQQITQPVDTEGITNGPILILLVVLLIAILGGMYRWFVILNNPEHNLVHLVQLNKYKKEYPLSRIRKDLTNRFEIAEEFIPFENQYHHFERDIALYNALIPLLITTHFL